MKGLRSLWTSIFGRPSKATATVIIDADSLPDRVPESFPNTKRGVVSWKTLISSPQTPTESLTAGIATCPPKQGHLCVHQHKQAEIYYITAGRGVMHVDGVEQTVGAGSVVYIPGDAKHGIRNEDPDEELMWLYVFPSNAFTDVKYKF